MSTTAPGPPRAMPADWRDARRLLRGPLRTLVTGQALGQAGDGFAQVAFAQVVLFEVGQGATPAEIAGVLAATLLPYSIVGPFAGVVIDRWDRRRVLVTVSYVRVALAIASIAVVVTESEPLAYVGILTLLATSRFVLTAKGAALPRTVAADELVAANAVSSIAGLLAGFTAAVLAAMFVAVAPAAGFVAAAGVYVVAARAFRRLPGVGGGDTAERLWHGVQRVARELADGFRVAAREPAIRRPLAAVATHRFLLGAGFVVLVLVADERFGLEAPGYGLALAVTGVGAFVGTTAAPVIARRHRSEGVAPFAFTAAGLAAMLAGFTPELAPLVLALGGAALAFQVLKVLADALVGAAARDEVRGRVFSIYDLLYNVAFVAAGLALVPLWDPGRERELLWGIALGFVAAGLVFARVWQAWPWTRGTGEPATSSAPDRRHRLLTRAGALMAGALPALAFPEPSWWWWAWGALVPWLFLLRAAPDRREAGRLGWWGGTGFALAVHHWLVPNLTVFTLPVAILLGALWVPWGRLVWSLLAGRSAGRRAAAALALVPAAWIAIEAVRSWERLGGPWGLLGTSQWNRPEMLAAAAFGGAWLVSALIVTCNTGIAVAVARGTPRGTRVVAGAVAVAAVLVSPARFATTGDLDDQPNLRVAAVQPGVVHRGIERFEVEEDATRALIGQPVDLVVWGESSVSFDLDERPDLVDRIAALSRDVGADILVNTDARRGTAGGIYKSSVLVGPDGPRGRYDKMRLVPFGEYIPLRFLFGWTGAVTEAAAEDRRRGADLTLLRTAGVDVGPLVCFESAFPDMTRRLAGRGADVVLVQSATSTFQDSWAPEQHAALAAVRAVESGRPFVHATLTGVTTASDARGRRLAWLGTDATGVAVFDVPLARAWAPHVWLGEWVPALAFTILGIGAILAGLRAARRADGGAS